MTKEREASGQQQGSVNRGEGLLKTLPQDHVLSTMITEHQQIIGLLRDLDISRSELVKTTSVSRSRAILKKFRRYSKLLLEIESHNLREENVICLELEKREVAVIPETVRQEHVLLKPQMHRLFDLVAPQAGYKEFSVLQSEVDEAMDRLISNFMLHIQKENEILYPLALDKIDDPATWEEMRSQCDQIGYCSFTSGH